MRDDFFKVLPRKFIEVITGAFRDEGRRWLENLPNIIGELEQNWAVEISKNPFPNLSYHYVAPCVSHTDGSRAVVKIGFPGESQAMSNEVQILKFLAGDGAVRFISFDEQRTAMLLEKLEPGENLKTVYLQNKSQAVETAIGAMRRFWREPPPNQDFPTLEHWFEGLRRAEKINFAPEYVGKARRFFDELNYSPAPKKLLHGDFHHENILSARREPFLVIDPKGIVGDPAYDITVFLINHRNWLAQTGESNAWEKIDETILRFADAFKIEPLALRKWTFAQSVLSAVWTFEENGENWQSELAKAEIWL